MPCRRLALNAAAVVTMIVLAAAAMAADILEQPPSFLELRPGMTKIVKVNPNRPVQSIAIGNPNIADVSAINLGAIAVTGKGIGLTNFILFDVEGKEISDTVIQVVEAEAYRDGGNVTGRQHEIKVFSMWGGKLDTPDERRYLCSAQNCSTIQVVHPIELNPPGNTSAAVGTTTSKTISTVPTPEAPQGSQAGAPQGK
jgi:hypothetical protein